MKDPLKLTAIFLEHASVRVAVPEDVDEFESLLLRAWETGRERWPQVALPADVFVRHLAQRSPKDSEGDPLALVLERLALPDLYLACACVHEVPTAIKALERHYLAKVSVALGKTDVPTAVVDEVCQMVRIQLLVGTGESGPEIAGYEGLGALKNWILSIATRRARKEISKRREAPVDNVPELVKLIPDETDMDRKLIERLYGPDFLQAVHEAFAALKPRPRYLLRLHFKDRFSTTRMATLFRVNQSTISRWLKNARQEVYEETKRRLQLRFSLSSRDYVSLLEVIKSQFDLRLSQVLKEQANEEVDEAALKRQEDEEEQDEED